MSFDEARIARNEAVFRRVNEHIEDVNRAFSSVTRTMEVVCECGDLNCVERFTMSVPEYEQLRADPLHFALVPGHELPEEEDVIAHGNGFVIVRKRPGIPGEVASSTDPRSGGHS